MEGKINKVRKTKFKENPGRCRDLKEWCNEEIYIRIRKAHNRDAWKMIVNPYPSN